MDQDASIAAFDRAGILTASGVHVTTVGVVNATVPNAATRHRECSPSNIY
jgi:hypothetical protein